MEWYYGIGLTLAGLVGLAALARHWVRGRPDALLNRIERAEGELAAMVPLRFLIQPCFRCHEFAMKLLGISPNGRSVHYQCSHCERKMRAPAGTPDADRAIGIWIGLCQAVEEYNARPDRSRAGAGPIEADVQFDAPPAPLPFEQTTRSPIPEAVGGEVWRRDGAACVRCGSKQNLQFDHIIPVALGGATSAANLQLLCQPCNAAKGMRI